MTNGEKMKKGRPARAPALNKQRITKTTRREILAAGVGHLVDESEPPKMRAKLLALLKKNGIEPKGLDVLVTYVNVFYQLWRDFESHDAVRLTPKEELAQVINTKAKIDDLLQSIDSLNGHAHGELLAVLHAARMGTPDRLNRRLAKDLSILSDALGQVGDRMSKWKSRPGRDPNSARLLALSTLSKRIVELSGPAMSLAQAKRLTVDLLRARGMTLPTDEREIRRLFSEAGGKSASK